uniref:Uncharacterized protein n=1 Tax=Anguilla anguilla TaxID=7936 RepID=A0A0E9V306_ANGAN
MSDRGRGEPKHFFTGEEGTLGEKKYWHLHNYTLL